MAGRGRGATLPAWLTADGGALAGSSLAGHVLPEPTSFAMNTYTPAQEMAPYIPVGPNNNGGGYDNNFNNNNNNGSSSSSSGRGRAERGRGRRRSETPDRDVSSWTPRPAEAPSNFDVMPIPGEDPPLVAILPQYCQHAPTKGEKAMAARTGMPTNPYGPLGGLGGPPRSVPRASQEPSMQQTRHARRIYVGNLPLGVPDVEINNFFNSVMEATLPRGYMQRGELPVVTVYVVPDKQFGFVEFATMDLTAAALSLDGVSFNYRPDQPVAHLKIKRPNDFKPELCQLNNVPVLDLQVLGMVPAQQQQQHQQHQHHQHQHQQPSTMVGGIARTVADGPNKIFVGGLPYHLTDAQVLEVLQSFGPLKAFHLVRDPGMANSKGYAFCEYMDPNVTHVVVRDLHGLPILDKQLTVKAAGDQSGGGQGGAGARSSVPAAMGAAPGMPQWQQQQQQPMMSAVPGMAPGPMGARVPPAAQYGSTYPPGPQNVAPAALANSKVLKLSNMVTREDLQNDAEFLDIRDDVMTECSTFGKVFQVIIPRVKDGFPAVTEGFIFVEFEHSYGAAQAKMALTGRKFADKVVIVDYFDEAKYGRKIYT